MDSTYTALLRTAKLNPDKTDFTELRHAYATSPEYRPYFPSTDEDIDDFESLFDARKAKHFEKAIILAYILTSVFQSGDGETYQTAFKVINLREEHAILQFLKLKRVLQQMDYDQGHNFDVFETIHPKSNQHCRMYFNTDFIWEYRNNGLTSQTT